MIKRFASIKKWQKITLYSLFFLILAGFLLYQYAIRHAASILEELVQEKSNGTVALKVNNVKFRWIKNIIQLNNAHIYNTQRDEQNKYDFYIKELSLNMTDVFGLIFNDNISITQISLNQPRIVVETIIKNEENNNHFSTEAGNVFSSIQDALHAVHVNKFDLKQGSFTLLQRTDSLPISITLNPFNLQIDNFNTEEDTEDRLLFSDNIYFETYDQNLIFPDGKYKIQFKKLSIGTQNSFIHLDSCIIANVHSFSNKSNINLFFDTLRLTGLDFKELYKNDLIVADSMFGKNALLDLQLNLSNKNNQSGIDSILTSLGADINLKYVGVENLSTKIQTTKQGKTADFKTNGDDITIKTLKIKSEGPESLEIGQFELALRDYVSYTADSLYQFKFDSIKFVNTSVVLSNLDVSSYKNSNVKEKYKIPQFILSDLDWEELLMNQHLKAKNASLYSPDLQFNQYVKNVKGNPKSIYDVFSDIRKFIYMEHISIFDGSLNILSYKKTNFKFENIRCRVDIDELLKAQSSSMIESSVEAFHFDRATLKAAGLDLKVYNVEYNPNDTYFHIDSFFLNDSTSQLNINANRVWLHSPSFDEEISHLQLDSLKWERGSLEYKKREEVKKSFPISLFIGYIQGEKTNFDLAYQQHIKGYLNQINAFNLEVNEEKIFKIQQVDANGKTLQIFDDQFSIQTFDYVISDHQASKFKNFEFIFYNHPDTLKVLADEIDFLPGNTNLKQKIFEVDRLALYEPTVIYNQYQKEKTNNSIGNIDTIQFLFKELVFLNPQIQYNDHYENRIDNITWSQSSKNNKDHLTIQNGFMRLDSNVYVSIDKMDIDGQDITINESFAVDFTYSSQPIKAAIREIEIAKTTLQPSWKWKAFVENFEHKGMEIGALGKDEGNILISEGRYSTFWIRDEWKDPFEALKNNPQLKIKIGASSFSKTTTINEWSELNYNAGLQQLNIEGFKSVPSVSLTEFLKQIKYQEDYITCEIPEMKLTGLQWEKNQDKWVTLVSTLALSKMNFSAYRDKHAVFDSLSLKKMPIDLVKQLGMLFYIKEVQLQQSQAMYSELGWNKIDTGKVIFSNINATLYHLKNYQYNVDDSLVVMAQGRLFEKIPVGLNFKQSYVDSLRGFNVTMIIGETELRLLNPTLYSLANVGVRKGHLKQLTVQAAGNTYFAYGKTLIQYDQLRVRINQKNRTSVDPIKTILANTLVIDNRNKKTDKWIFVDRYKNRSIFNYLVRIVFDAVATTVGVEKEKVNKKRIQDLRLLKRNS